MRIIMLYFKCILWWFYRELPGNKTNEKTPTVTTAGWTWVGISGKKMLALKIWMRKGKRREFSNSLMVKTLHSHCRGSGFDPCWGTKMPHDAAHSQKKKKWVREERLSRVPWTTKRSKQSILKEINPEYSLEGQMLKLKLQYFGHHNKRSKTWNGVKREQKPVFPNYTNYRRVMREI